MARAARRSGRRGCAGAHVHGAPPRSPDRAPQQSQLAHRHDEHAVEQHRGGRIGATAAGRAQQHKPRVLQRRPGADRGGERVAVDLGHDEIQQRQRERCAASGGRLSSSSATAALAATSQRMPRELSWWCRIAADRWRCRRRRARAARELRCCARGGVSACRTGSARARTRSGCPCPARSRRRPCRPSARRAAWRSRARAPCRRTCASSRRRLARTAGRACSRASGAMPMPVSVTSTRSTTSRRRRRRASRAHDDLARGRELDRVGHEVRDDLVQPRGVAADERGAVGIDRRATSSRPFSCA